MIIIGKIKRGGKFLFRGHDPFGILKIHPFEDGNGRTARLLEK
ncbi:MAG TPA: Fic family protein [Bacteroidetes bacterium]|nr:Fic family protein [Bacteroidota bacterium]